MWKFHDFSVIQILREINLGQSKSCKNAIFAHFWYSEFYQFCKFQPSKSEKIHKNQNSETLNVVKWLILHFKNPEN